MSVIAGVHNNEVSARRELTVLLHHSFAGKNITAAKTVVHGTLPYVPVPVPFPVDNPDACKDQGIECPMFAGKTYTFKTVLPIKSLYPKVSNFCGFTTFCDWFKKRRTTLSTNQMQN